jgi:hypothetical protein
MNYYRGIKGEKSHKYYKLYLVQCRIAIKGEILTFVEILAILSLSSALLQDFRFTGIRVTSLVLVFFPYFTFMMDSRITSKLCIRNQKMH